MLTALTPLLGGYMARVYTGERVFLTPIFGPVERLTYRLLRANPNREQDWKSYARTVIVFSALFWVVLYVILRTQGIQPFNPAGFDSGTADVSFNTVSSFISNTNWQYYGGETTLSYFAQMAGLAVQNFVSAAVGMAVLVAVIRGFIARSGKSLGNFWQDLVRSLLYVLVPISFVAALVLVSQGVIQTLAGPESYTTVTGAEQTLALGPGASQIAIKQLGTNGGGFFNVNSSFPFENPTAFASFVEMLLILLIPAALTATFGRMVGNRRQGWSLYVAMLVMLVVSIGVGYGAEQNGSPAQKDAGLELAADEGTTGGNLEGKEQRYGIVASDRVGGGDDRGLERLGQLLTRLLHGIGGLVPLSADVDRGGGLRRRRIGPLRDAAVRPAGGLHSRADGRPDARVPGQEDRGARGEAGPDRHPDVPLLVLVTTALAIATPYGDPSIYNPGPQGFSETLYAYTSQGNNNGSAFAGYTGYLQPNAPGNVGAYGITFADLLGGLTMLIGRFVPLLAALAVAGVARRQAGRAGRAGHLPHRHPDLRRPADRRDRDRRRAHLLPRLPARTDRPGPDPGAVLRCVAT